MLIVVVTLASLSCLLLPNWLAIALLPALHVLQRLAVQDPVLFSAGGMDLRPLDLATLAILGKFAVGVALRREVEFHRGAGLVLGGWLGVNLLVTLLAGLKFGSAHLVPCLVSWLRVASEVVMIPILAISLREPRQVRHCVMLLLVTLGALVVIQFVNVAGAGRGFTIGEVQGLERDTLRYFGPVGDSVGFVFLFAYCFALCRSNPGAIAATLSAILLTAGLGALLGTAVATGIFLLLRSRMVRPAFWEMRRVWVLPLVLFAFGFAAFKYGQPLSKTLVERFTTGAYAESGTQRQQTAAVALAMIADNPISGVGFLGFRLALGRYGGERYFNLRAEDGASANANNQLLQALTDGGILGLAAFVLLVAWSVRLFFRLASRTAEPIVAAYFWAACIWLLALTFGNVAATWVGPSSFVTLLLWTSIGLALAQSRFLPAEEPAAISCPANLELARP